MLQRADVFQLHNQKERSQEDTLGDIFEHNIYARDPAYDNTLYGKIQKEEKKTEKRSDHVYKQGESVTLFPYCH